MLASTIQFTTNTPTPNKQPQLKVTIRVGGVRSGALLQNPDSMPSPLKPRPSLPKDKAMPKNEFPNGSLAVPKQKLLRKEVIQPHLPVRLPCYDFVPIASPTFNRSP